MGILAGAMSDELWSYGVMELWSYGVMELWKVGRGDLGSIQLCLDRSIT